MTIDERTGRFWTYLPAAQKWAFFSCVVVGYLVHLYAFTNLIPNGDGLSRVFDYQQMTVSGRWFLHYASVLNGFTQMPAAIGLLSLLLLGLSAALIVDLLGIRGNVLAALSGGLLAAFPCVGYTFLYLFTASAYCLAIFMAVLSVWMARRGRLGWVLGVLLLALTMGTYQAYVTVAIGLSMLLVLRNTMLRKAEFSDTLKLGLSLVAYLAAGALLYYVLLLVVLEIKDLELLSYLGMDAASSGYPFAQLPSLVVDTYAQVILFFFLAGSANGFANGWMVVLNVVLLALAAWFVYRRLRGKDLWEPWRLIGIAAMVLLFPIGINFGQIISPYSVPTPLMKFSYVLVYLAVLMVLQLADNIEKNLGWPPVVALVAVCGLLFSFSNTNNLIYTASAQAHRATESYLTRLLTRVEDCPGYESGMEVVVIGAIPEKQLYSDIESYLRVDHYSVPRHLVADLNKHIYYYWNDWMNVPIAEPEEETMLAVSASKEFRAMPLYPEQGSVKVLDGRVVVKLRERYTPKSDFELAYEQRR